METSTEIIESWDNGNTTDVIDHLVSAHPCVAALVILELTVSRSGRDDATRIVKRLIERKIDDNERS